MHRRDMILALAAPAAVPAAARAVSSTMPLSSEQPSEPPKPDLEAFTLDELDKQRGDRAYLSFLQRSTLHCGIYALAAGATDRQNPHDEDEVYYVLEGKGKFTVDGHDPVDAVKGAILFVAAHASHRFHDIEEDLKLLVFFSRAKTP